MLAKKQIKQQVTGTLYTVTIEKKKYVLQSPSDEYKLLIKKEIEAYNNKNSEARVAKLIKLLTPKETKKKEELLVVKKKTKQQTKVVKKLTASIKKETKKVVSSIKLGLDPRFEITPLGAMRLKGYPIDMPAELVVEVAAFRASKTPLEPLINFWMLAMLNPNPVARDKMFGYLSRHKLILTPSGYFVTYRMVKKTDKPDEFTHAHYANPMLIYRPNTVCRIPREDCDEDGSRDCSRGLHTGTPDFIGIKGVGLGEGYDKGERKVVDKANGGGFGTGYDRPVETTQRFDNSFGNQAIICLVNPMHVVSVPNSDTRKMRSCEFFFCKLTTPEEVIDLQTNAYHIFDHTYKEFEVNELKEMLKTAKLTNITKNSLGIKVKDGKKLEEAEQKLTDFKQILASKTGDSINKDLSADNIKAIIAARIKKGK